MPRGIIIVRFIFLCNDKKYFTYLLFVTVFLYDVHNMFVKCFQERYVWSQLKQSILVHAMISQDWLFLDRPVYLNMGSFIVFRLLMYWAYSCTWGFVINWQRERLLRSCVLVLSNHAKLCVFYSVLMYLKVVIEDQVEDTKFAQEKVKKNTFLAFFQHVPR